MNEEKVAKIESDIEHMKEDIRELKEAQKQSDNNDTELKINVSNLVNSLSVTNDKLDKLCNAFESKEKEDNKDSKEVTKLIRNTIITGVVGTIIGAILALVL